LGLREGVWSLESQEIAPLCKAAGGGERLRSLRRVLAYIYTAATTSHIHDGSWQGKLILDTSSG
jgi:hypothetical protein